MDRFLAFPHGYARTRLYSLSLCTRTHENNVPKLVTRYRMLEPRLDDENEKKGHFPLMKETSRGRIFSSLESFHFVAANQGIVEYIPHSD